MTRSKYLSYRNELIDNCLNLKFKHNENLYGQFNMVSAGLTNYLSSINFKHHEDIYRKILLHKKLSILEQSCEPALQFLEVENLDNQTLKYLQINPAIICTFHTGSYRLINLLLVKYKIPFSLVISRNVIEKEREGFSNLYNDLSDRAELSNFALIDAEATNAGFQMLRSLKEKKTLLFYIDGNSGSGSMNVDNSNCCLITFLEQRLFVRKGISFLANKASVPIIPVASYRTSWENIHLKFFDSIPPCKKNVSNPENTTQEIYNLVSPLVAKFPEQWEAWLYLHKFANIKIDECNKEVGHCKSGRLVFNPSCFGVLKINNIPYLFNKKCYVFYKITDSVFEFLNECSLTPVKNGRVSSLLIKEFLNKKVLLSV
ncbi:MAG: hypothetical protein QM764_08875 [Chitinophagaceae bacterium]